MKIQELIFDIGNNNLVLPEFQREYVWTRDQTKKLIESLFKEYPIGSFLFWKTNTPPDLKNIPKNSVNSGIYQVILDGQQRLTALYLLITGDIPPFYKEREIEFDPRDLYFNLSNTEFKYHKPTEMKSNPLWVNVVGCFNNSNVNISEIVEKISDNLEERLNLQNVCWQNLTKLRNIKEKDIPVQIVPSDANLDRAIDIFDLVNSQGTKLTDAELALTHITGKWSDARREIKKKIEELEKHNFYFDLNFMTRVLTGIVTNRALFETIHDKPKDELVEGWEKSKKILDYLTNVLPSSANIHSNKDLNSSNVLIPLIVYLSVNGGKFKTQKILKNAIYWLYAAQIWARYSSQTDSKLEKDLSIIIREESPWDSLKEEIIDQRGRIEVRPIDFEGREAPHPLYRMSYILAKTQGAIDWFNGSQLEITHGNKYEIHSHHIFPQSILYKNIYKSESHIDMKKVNQIANRAFLTAETNLSISNNLPEIYLEKVEENYPGALKKQFIPMDRNLWKLENYEDFVAERRNIISKEINNYMNNLTTEPTETRKKPIKEIILTGESLNLELKTTLQWDAIRESLNTNLRYSVLKTIAAFLNSEGGELIVGVEDNGKIYGIEKDLATLGNSLDKFNQLLSSLIFENIGAQYIQLIKIRFEDVESKKICIIEVEQSSIPAYLKGPKGSEFYIRAGTTSRYLDPSQTVDYVTLHWET
jgi:hypothetical protein